MFNKHNLQSPIREPDFFSDFRTRLLILASENILDEEFAGLHVMSILKVRVKASIAHLVTTPYERSTGNIEEAHSLGDLFPPLKFTRFHISVDLHMPLRRPHILAKRDNIHLILSQLSERIHHLIL